MKIGPFNIRKSILKKVARDVAVSGAVGAGVSAGGITPPDADVTIALLVAVGNLINAARRFYRG